MACCFPKLPKIRIVPESSHPHFCANLENPGRRLRYSGSPGSAAGDICITCGIRRHRHRSDCLARSAEACQPGASLQFPALAGLRNLGPDRGSKLGHNGAPPQPSRSFHGGHEVLPLSLIPTFLVPLFLIFHVISIAQARGWTASYSHSTTAPVPAFRDLSWNLKPALRS